MISWRTFSKPHWAWPRNKQNRPVPAKTAQIQMRGGTLAFDEEATLTSLAKTKQCPTGSDQTDPVGHCHFMGCGFPARRAAAAYPGAAPLVSTIPVYYAALPLGARSPVAYPVVSGLVSVRVTASNHPPTASSRPAWPWPRRRPCPQRTGTP